MAQQFILINNYKIWQPDEKLSYSWETTYSEDTQRLITGQLVETPLFTVEQLGYSATNVPVAEAVQIIQRVCKGQRFNLTYFSMYYGVWRTDVFYVGKGNLAVGRLSIYDDNYLDSLSFNMTGINPL